MKDFLFRLGRTQTCAMLAAMLVVTPVRANFCGCNDAIMTRKVIAAVQADTDDAVLNKPAVRTATQALEQVLVRVELEVFNADYAGMTPPERAALYAQAVSLSDHRVQATQRLRDVMAAAGASETETRLLDRHIAMMKLAPAERVATLKQANRLLAVAERSDNPMARWGASMFRDTCVKQGFGSDTGACAQAAVAASDRNSPRHFSGYASSSGPLEIIRGALPEKLAEMRG